MVPVYNTADYLRETLRSVLDACGDKEIQIEAVDNCSTRDDPEAVVREFGGRVAFYRQPQNVGPIENFNTCIRRARGEWVHILHSDDLVLPGFYSRAWNGLSVGPQVGAALCRFMHIDAHGRRAYYDRNRFLSDLEAPGLSLLDRGFVERLLLQQRIQFAGIVVRRSIYEQIGGFRHELPYCTDWDMWIRIALSTSILYEPEPFASYRLHAGADSTEQVRTGNNVADKRHAIQLASSYVPPSQAKRNYQRAMKAAAIDAIAHARRLWKSGNRTVAMRQIREAVRCSLSPAVLLRLGYFGAYALANRGRYTFLTAKGPDH
jgi:glycosyltransferase involved in cell wall biosynthesis